MNEAETPIVGSNAAIPHHRKEYTAGPSGKGDDHLVVPLALVGLALVAGLGHWIAQGREGREELSALQDSVPSRGGMLTADGTAPEFPRPGRWRMPE